MSNNHKPGDLAVSVQDLGLIYRTIIDKKASLPTRIKSLGRGRKQTRIVNALDGVNLDIDYGSVLGVVGANGAGAGSFAFAAVLRRFALLPLVMATVKLSGSLTTKLW